MPAEDDLRGVVLRVQRIQGDDRPGQVGEGGEQVPDGGDLGALRGHGDLPEDRADAVREGRDQVRGLPVLPLRAPHGLPVDGDDQPPDGPRGPGEQPGAEDLVEDVGADQGERAPVSRLVCRAAVRAERGEHVRAGVAGPLADRGERPRARDHRRDSDGEQPGQGVTAPAPLTRVTDLGQQIEQVQGAGSTRYQGRWHQRAGVPRGRRRRA